MDSHAFHRPWPAIRNWKVAAPLKLVLGLVALMVLLFNPQLKSCGSIEAKNEHWCFASSQDQSATEKLRLHWSPSDCLRVAGVDIQSATEKLRLHWSLKSFWTRHVNGYQSATEKLRLHWSEIKCNWLFWVVPTIRNWKVAAPLKLIWPGVYAPSLPQSATEKLRLHWSEFESILMSQHLQQSATEKLRLHWSRLRFLPLGHYRTDNPQLKSCGSIEAKSSATDCFGLCQQSATEKLRLHWSLFDLVCMHRAYHNPQLKSCGSIEANLNRS